MAMETASTRKMETVSQRSTADLPPAISVVLPVLNEALDIGRLLGEILDQESPVGGFEVLVVDGGSTDETRAIVTAFREEHPNLRLLENPRRLSSSGRNVGARAARGKYVLFLDGHCSIPRKDYLVRTLDLFESTGAACLCRPQPLNRLTEGKWDKAISSARHSWLGHNTSSDIFGGPPAFTDPRSAGAAYARTCLEQLGGYDERFDACEDVEFNHRVAMAGFSAYRHPDLQVDYRPRSTLEGFFRQMIRYGRGRARLMIRHRNVVPWPLAMITAWAFAVPFTLAFAGIRVGALFAATPIVPWILLVGAECIRLAGVRSAALRTMLAFLAIYIGLVFGFWRGLAEFGRFRSAASS